MSAWTMTIDDSFFDNSAEQTWGPDDDNSMTEEEFASSIWINLNTWDTVLHEQLVWAYEKIRDKIQNLISKDYSNYM